MRYIDVVLDIARRRAWEALSDEQRAAHLKNAIRDTGIKQSMSTIRRWAVQTGPKGDGV